MSRKSAAICTCAIVFMIGMLCWLFVHEPMILSISIAILAAVFVWYSIYQKLRGWGG